MHILLFRDNSNEKKKVSVIILTYNCANYIENSINSALAHYVLVEIIVLDDCSKDHIDTNIQKYTGNKQVLYVKNKVNMDVAKTRNKGVQHATGEWVAFLNVNDYWEEGKLEKTVEVEFWTISAAIPAGRCTLLFEKAKNT